MVRFYHASLASPPASTLIAAINAGYLRGCPGLTETNVRKHIHVEMATEMGHMKQVQQGTRSTTKQLKRGRPSKKKMDECDKAMEAQPQAPNNAKTNVIYMTMLPTEGMVTSNQTGPFPRASNRGMRYVCVFYIHDTNFILGIPIHSRHKENLVGAYQEAYNFCKSRGYKPQLHKMDNESSHEVEQFIEQQGARIQYTPPDMHRTNPAERCIQTWKAAMKSTLALLPSTFLIGFWCRLIPQVNLSVNLLRPCRQNPKLSAWAAMQGEFHFGAMSIAPPGSEMYMHDKPNRRRSWGYNAKKAWYIGPSLDHYRSFRGVLPSTGAEQISDTVRFNHHAVKIPNLTPADRILEATKQLKLAIQQQPKQASMDEISTIELLGEVLLGESKQKSRERSVPRDQTNQRPAQATSTPREKIQPLQTTPQPSKHDLPTSVIISQDKEDPCPDIRRST